MAEIVKKKPQPTSHQTVQKIRISRDYENSAFLASILPFVALERFRNGTPVAEDLKTIQVRLAVGDTIAYLLYEEDANAYMEDALFAIDVVAKRFIDSVGTVLRASPMERELISNGLLSTDAMIELLTDRQRIMVYKEMQKTFVNNR